MQQTYSAPALKRRPAWPGLGRLSTWVLLAGAGIFFLVSVSMVAAAFGVAIVYASGRILPGVSVAGIALGTLTLEDASAELQNRWAQITVRDGNRLWQVTPTQLGLTLDAEATALAAQRYGRADGSGISAFFGLDPVAPVLTVDPAAAEAGLKVLAATVEQPAQNATIRMNGSEPVAVAAVEGRVLDLQATLSKIVNAPADALSSGALELVMVTTQPTVTDASPLLEKARTLLSSPLTVNAFDPVTNQNAAWTLGPEQWGQWLTTENAPSGLVFSVETNALTNYLNGQNGTLGEGRHIDTGKAVEAVSKAVSAYQTSAWAQVYHSPTKYVVQPGDTIGTVAWKKGVQMWRIIKANGGQDMLSAGQTITIPSLDDLLPLPVVQNKRIVVSISKQRMWVYENGQVKWDWAASTGIPDSPTAPGVYQIQSHERNAYAGNWNLWMPYFMGIYEAVPGFMNGIHGFPTRNGQGILWEANLGSPVTYGCILISSKNADALFNWAEEGVVIEIQR